MVRISDMGKSSEIKVLLSEGFIVAVIFSYLRVKER
jgi:hypothetical protein